MKADSDYVIRGARAEDAAAMVEIYRPFIEQSCVSFEVEVPLPEEFAARVNNAQDEHDWLVAENAQGLLGYAYGSKHRGRAAYQYTAEVSAYVSDQAQGIGVGRALYESLFRRLKELGYCNVVAGITLPNDKSTAFHLSMGFTLVGTYHGVGFKFEQWRDVAWYERKLRSGPPPNC
jgi:L-amino acid N-acyltransferase YncA